MCEGSYSILKKLINVEIAMTSIVLIYEIKNPIKSV